MANLSEESIVKIGRTQNEYMRRRFSTKNSQYTYDIQKLQFFNNISFALLLLYFIVAAVYLGILFVGPDREKNTFFYKLVVLVILVLYPFLVTPIEYFTFRGLLFVVETAIGKVFERDDYEFLIDLRNLPG